MGVRSTTEVPLEELFSQKLFLEEPPEGVAADRLESLPAEVRFRLLSYVHPERLQAVAEASDGCNAVIEDEYFWKGLVEEKRLHLPQKNFRQYLLEHLVSEETLVARIEKFMKKIQWGCAGSFIVVGWFGSSPDYRLDVGFGIDPERGTRFEERCVFVQPEGQSCRSTSPTINASTLTRDEEIGEDEKEERVTFLRSKDFFASEETSTFLYMLTHQILRKRWNERYHEISGR